MSNEFICGCFAPTWGEGNIYVIGGCGKPPFTSTQYEMVLGHEMLRWQRVMGWQGVEMFQLRSGVNPNEKAREWVSFAVLGMIYSGD